MDAQAWTTLIGIVVAVLTTVSGAMIGIVWNLALKVNTLEAEHKHWQDAVDELKQFLNAKSPPGTP